VRIITGSARGRRLVCPDGLGTRPILDAQKQALFNVLGSRVDVDGVMDIFAGSGGLGLEALSRGARRAVFVEKGRAALDCLRRNIETCGFDERARVVASDIFRIDWERLPHAMDLVFIDAPFPMFTDDRERLTALLRTMVDVPAVNVGAYVVWRMPDDAEEIAPPSGLETDDVRDYGRSRIFLFRKSAQAAQHFGRTEE